MGGQQDEAFEQLWQHVAQRISLRPCPVCGELKRGSSCSYCGARICGACKEVKPLAEFAGEQQGVWYCHACGFRTCRSCGRRLPLRDFRDPVGDPSCRDCAVWRPSEQERADLEREERAYRRRVREGHRPTDQELREREVRRAALLGLSPRKYRQRMCDYRMVDLAGFAVYLLSASLVAVVAIGYWVYAVLDGSPAAAPALAAIAINILVLCVWPLLWGRFVAPAPAYDDFVRWSLERSDDGSFELLLMGVGLLLPVISYLLVLAFVTSLWP